MRILLVNPPSVNTKESVVMPVGLASLATHVVKNGNIECQLHDLNLIFCETQSVDDCYKSLKDTASQFKPDVVGFTTLCNTYPLVLEYAKKIKDAFNPTIVLGGVQATLTALATMEHFKWIDVIVKHEGEITFCEYIDALIENKSIQTVKGLVYRDGSTIKESPEREFIHNLDDLAEIDYNFLKISEYHKLNKSISIPIEIGRGCPFNCAFCSTSVMWRHACRMKSPLRVFEEMNNFNLKYGFKDFELVQDNFTTKAKFVKDLCYLLKNNEYKWGCYSRCDLMTNELMQLMKNAGCNHVFYGVETGSESIQKKIGKNLKLGNKEEAIAMAIDAGLKFTTSYMIGYPEESLADIGETLRHALYDAASGAKRVLISILTPLPETKIFDLYQDSLVEPLMYNNEVSPLKYVSANMKNYVNKHRDIFTSFYFIEHPKLELNYLISLKSFILYIIDNYPKTFFVLTHLQFTSILHLFNEYIDISDSSKNFDYVVNNILNDRKIFASNKKIIDAIYKYEQIINKLKNDSSEYPKMTDCLSSSSECNQKNSLFVANPFRAKRFPFNISCIIKADVPMNVSNINSLENCEELILFVSKDEDIVSYKVDTMLLKVLSFFLNPVSYHDCIALIERRYCIPRQRIITIIDSLLKNGIIYNYIEEELC